MTRAPLPCLLIFALSSTLRAASAASAPSAAAQGAAGTAAEERLRAAVLLERATWGPRPGELESVLQMGSAAWLERQLHPERIDDGAVTRRLSSFADLDAPTGELLQKYPRPDARERKEMKELREKRREAAEADGGAGGEMRAGRTAAGDLDEMRGPRRVVLQLAEARIVRAVESERQLEDVLVDFWFNHFNVYARKDIPTSLALPSYEREAIRPHVLGRFEEILRATAQHPAMLRYLDNWVSTREGFDPRAAVRERSGRGGMSMRGYGEGPRGRSRFRKKLQADGRRVFGLNENYGRELLELHTLGVDGGYRQEDVTEVARCFTGWTVFDPESIAAGRDSGRRRGTDGEFHFLPDAHEPGPKRVLGQTIDAGGMEDGLAVLRLLARHPATARHLCRKLAQRFVAEDPSEAIVDEMVAAWSRTDGSIRDTLSAMFSSPRFLEEAARRDKVKTPMELVASALRATSSRVLAGEAIAKQLADLGMPLYGCQPPTGYDEVSETWLSAGGMLGRVRFVGALASGRIPGVRVPPAPADLDAWAASVLPRGGTALSEADVATLREGLTSVEGLAPASSAEAMALRLASPEFQRQ